MAHYIQTGTDPVLHFDTGHPTRLENFPRLGALLAEHGDPYKVERSGAGYKLSWWPLYPGLDAPTYEGSLDPWNDGRNIVRVTGTPSYSKMLPWPPKRD